MRLFGFFLLFVFAFPAQADKGPLRVGVTGKYPPFNYYSSDGDLIGFDVDVAKALCEHVKRECKFVTLQWDGILSALLTNRIDAIIGSMAITEARQKQAAFTVPYYESGAQLLVPPEAPSPESTGFRIGVTLGTTYKTFAEERFPKAVVRSYKGDTEVLQDIKSGRLDAILTDRLVGLYMAKTLGADLQPWGAPLYEELMGIPVHPSKKELLSDLNQGITRLRASPKYRELYEKYFGGQALEAPDGYPVLKMLPLMLKALGSTVSVSLQGIGLGFLLAAVLAAVVLFAPQAVSYSISFLIDFIRSTPFMVQLFAIYFGLPSIGVEISPWVSAIVAIAIHSAAYLAEIAKMAYRSVPGHQHYAAQTLGLTRTESVRYVIWPQMLPVSIAPALNTVVAMIKDSALISVISVHELMMQTQELISATFKPMEFYLLSACLYCLVTYPLLILGKRAEHLFKKRGLLHG